jgi:hypothetical protein
MAEQLLHRLPDHDLEAVLRGLGATIDWPTPVLADGSDIAASVRARLEAEPVTPVEGSTQRRPVWRFGRPGWTLRPARRALVLAALALLVIAAVAGAAILGLPGLRLTLGEAPPTSVPTPQIASSVPPTPSPTPGPLGSSMGLGEPIQPIDSAALDDAAGFAVRWPDDPELGDPDAAYVDRLKGRQVTLLWAASDELPPTSEPSVGLILSQFLGAVDEGFFNKIVDAGTIVERVRVDGQPGFWLHGDPHIFFWEGVGGFVDDRRRWVGDVLLWADGPITYRLETSLGRHEAIRIAETLP